MFGPMVGRGFFDYMQREQGFLQGKGFFLKVDGDPEIELHGLEVRPLGFTRWPLVSGLDSIRFTFRDYIAFQRFSAYQRDLTVTVWQKGSARVRSVLSNYQVQSVGLEHDSNGQLYFVNLAHWNISSPNGR